MNQYIHIKSNDEENTEFFIDPSEVSSITVTGNNVASTTDYYILTIYMKSSKEHVVHCNSIEKKDDILYKIIEMDEDENEVGQDCAY